MNRGPGSSAVTGNAQGETQPGAKAKEEKLTERKTVRSREPLTLTMMPQTPLEMPLAVTGARPLYPFLRRMFLNAQNKT